MPEYPEPVDESVSACPGTPDDPPETVTMPAGATPLLVHRYVPVSG